LKPFVRVPPLALPIIFFAIAIACGTVILHSRYSCADAGISWLDALFTAASATCVTGLTVVDTGSFFSRFGQTVILVLIQTGGLGIMTFTSLAFYLRRNRISLVDRIAVGQSLLHDPSFHLGRFLKHIFIWTMLIEAAGGVLIFLFGQGNFSPYSAVFHTISAFCNAGFSLTPESLMSEAGNLWLNLIFMTLIILGGLGFSVIVELQANAVSLARGERPRLSWYSNTVISTSTFLIIFGWITIFLAEHLSRAGTPAGISHRVITSLFQSVSCRTAGFNTLDIGSMPNVSLLIMMTLMFIGGAPGSCAGGVKVTTFRAMIAFITSRIRGHEQTVIGRFALEHETLNRAIILIIFAFCLVLVSTLLLNITEGGDIPHNQTRGLFLETMFEAVSAFGTVGLSTGLTTKLSTAGKIIIIGLMFIGRLGPLIFLSALQEMSREQFYRWPEDRLLIG